MRYVLLPVNELEALRRLLETLGAVGNPLDCLLIEKALAVLEAAQIVNEDGELIKLEPGDAVSAVRPQ